MVEHIDGPLACKRIVVTRRRADAEEFCARLAALGATPICAPVIDAVAIASPALDQALAHLIDRPNRVAGNVILSFQCPSGHNPGNDGRHVIGSASEESSVAMRTPCGGVGGNVILSAGEESRVATRTLRCAQSDTTPPSPDTNHSASEESRVAMRTPCGGVGGNVILSASEESSVATRTLRCAQSDTTPPSPDTNHSASEESSVAMRTPCGGVGGNVIPSASEESSVATRTLRCAQSDTTPPSPDTNHSASEESSVATRTLRCAQSDTTPPSPDTNHSASEESSVATRTPCGGVGGNVILSASEESRVATRTLRCAQSDTTPPSPDTNHSASEESRVATRTLRCAQSDTTPPSPDTNHSASEESSVATRTPCGGVGGNVILSASEESRVATRTLRCAQSDTTPPSPNTNHSTSEESRVATRTLRCAQSDTTPPSPDTNHSASEESRVATRTLHCAQSDTTPPSPETNYYAWLVFTSAAAVEFFFARIAELSVQVRLPQVAAVGPATAARLWACAQVSALLPPEATGAALGRALPLAPGDRVLLPRAHSADPAIGAVLRERGAVVDDIAIYATTAVAPPPAALAELARGVDLLTFTSPSAVQAFLDHVPPQQVGSTLIACIGPTTARAVQARGLTVAAVARQASTDGLIEALVELCGNMEKMTGDG